MSLRSHGAVLLAVFLEASACGSSAPAADASANPVPDATAPDAPGAADAATPASDAVDAELPDAIASEDTGAGSDATDANDAAAADAAAADAAAADAATTDAAAATADGGAQPTEVAYVATYLGGISAFSLDTTTGALTPVPGSPFDRGAGFYAIAVTTSGHLAYAIDYLHGTINGYRILRSGALDALPTSPVNLGGGPVGLAVDPAERFLFVSTSEEPNRLFAYRIDRATGALTPVDHSPFATTDAPAVLAVDPQGRHLFVSSRSAFGIRVFAIGDTSGALTEVQGSPFGKAQVFGGGLAFSQVGHFVYSGGNGLHGFTYDDATGAMTEIDGSPFGQAGSDSTALDVAAGSTGSYVFAVHTAMQTLSAFTMDQGTGRLVKIPHSPFPAAPSPYSVAVDPSERFLLVGNDDADQVSVFSIEATPGDGLRPVALSPFTVRGLQPELAFVKLDDGP